MKSLYQRTIQSIAHSFKRRDAAELSLKLNARALCSLRPAVVQRYNLGKSDIFGKGSTATSRSFASNEDVIVVQHDPYMKMFYIEIDDIERAFIRYDIIDKTMIIFSTLVPDELRGRRVGLMMAKECLEYARNNNLKLDIQCKFVQHYINKYAPEYMKYVEP